MWCIFCKRAHEIYIISGENPGEFEYVCGVTGKSWIEQTERLTTEKEKEKEHEMDNKQTRSDATQTR